MLLLLLVINAGDKVKLHSNFEICTVLALPLYTAYKQVLFLLLSRNSVAVKQILPRRVNRAGADHPYPMPPQSRGQGVGNEAERAPSASGSECMIYLHSYRL